MENKSYENENEYSTEKEDSRMISLNQDDYDETEDADYKNYALPQQVIRGMGLDLSLADAKGKVYKEGIQESNVLVVFDLPDGSQGESSFKLGQTVELLKSFVESEYGIPMTEQTLFLENKLMMDPLSISDFPEAKGVDEIFVRVEGPIPSEAKK
mmetsp:Transcript_19537/g.18871  ORF Transcript_19537/g.18871 Transcript_19537/m.18871 type:complete len:155 (+) Transcript_19537:108-572(+)